LGRTKSRFVVCAVVLAGLAAACGAPPSPAAATLSDPKEIVTRSITGFQSVRTVHVAATLDGSVNAAALGSLSGGSMSGLTGTIKLNGSTLSGDVDISNRAAHLTATVPNLLGLTLDYILVDGYLYGKVSLGSEKYTRTRASTILPAGAEPSASLDLAGAIGTFGATLDQAGVTATLAGRDKVDGRDSYHVDIKVPNDKANQALSSIGSSALAGLSVDSLSIGYWVYVDTLQPARTQVSASSASLGHLDVTVTLTRYDLPVTVTAPPDSQVQPG
jgi:hypothetical protein